jgi:hypothetical protein
VEKPKLTFRKSGQLFFSGWPTGFYLERAFHTHGKREYWYLARPGYSHKQFARFNLRRHAYQAAIVFLEGATQGENESELDTARRALQLCLETGSTDVVRLTP